MRPLNIIHAILLTGLLATTAHTITLTPISYKMVNGATGRYTYWDDTYDGVGCTTCSRAPLSGGLGDLTDGVIAHRSWYIEERPRGAGPYVGWKNLNPTIEFTFANTVKIDQMVLYMDDANGYGGVSLPSKIKVKVDNDKKRFRVPNRRGSGAVAVIMNNLDFVGNTLSLTLYRNNAWIFMSEVAFSGSHVPTYANPEPSTMVLLGTGLFGLFAYARKRRAA